MHTLHYTSRWLPSISRLNYSPVHCSNHDSFPGVISVMLPCQSPHNPTLQGKFPTSAGITHPSIAVNHDSFPVVISVMLPCQSPHNTTLQGGHRASADSITHPSIAAIMTVSQVSYLLCCHAKAPTTRHFKVSLQHQLALLTLPLQSIMTVSQLSYGRCP
jgi:hypothetical protein